MNQGASQSGGFANRCCASASSKRRSQPDQAPDLGSKLVETLARKTTGKTKRIEGGAFRFQTGKLLIPLTEALLNRNRNAFFQPVKNTSLRLRTTADHPPRKDPCRMPSRLQPYANSLTNTASKGDTPWLQRDLFPPALNSGSTPTQPAIKKTPL